MEGISSSPHSIFSAFNFHEPLKAPLKPCRFERMINFMGELSLTNMLGRVLAVSLLLILTSWWWELGVLPCSALLQLLNHRQERQLQPRHHSQGVPRPLRIQGTKVCRCHCLWTQVLSLFLRYFCFMLEHILYGLIATSYTAKSCSLNQI